MSCANPIKAKHKNRLVIKSFLNIGSRFRPKDRAKK